MDSEKLSRALREMLPAGVCVAAGQHLAIPLTARERESLGAADVDRIREFESGRAYAKRALAMLGLLNVDLPIGPSRSPVWPTGVVGSITHVASGRHDLYAAAVVARTDDAILALGIDFEMRDSLHPHVWRHVLTKRELERILAFPVATRRTEAQYIWCAKEATAKIVGQPFEPSELEIERDPITGDFVVTNGMYSQRRVQGRTACLDGLVIATAVLPRELN
jgi:4'-phosphopantetheinyl transferase EntD